MINRRAIAGAWPARRSLAIAPLRAQDYSIAADHASWRRLRGAGGMADILARVR